MLSTVRRDTAVQGDLPTRILFTEKDFLSAEAHVVHPLRPSVRPRETGQDRGGEEEKLPFSCSFPPNPPCSCQEWPLSLD